MKYLYYSLALFILSSFITPNDDADYEKEIKEWHKNRIESLKKENGWLNLAGLFWLEEGRNSFGADIENKIIFPTGKSGNFLGEFILSNGEVFIEAKKGAEIYHENEKVEKLKIFPSEKPILLKHHTLRWFVIKRGNKYAIRLRDLDSPFLKEFHGIETFQIDKKWKLKAKFEPTVGKKIAILDVTGQTSQQDSPGKLIFTVAGKEYALDALAEGDELFIIFGDITNKKETYGAGRFVYAAKPDADGFTSLDFNKAYNPPCAFTPYATCPLPPKQNLLPIAISAGEKNYGNH
ncbi:protein of unknown function DUF1684 [Emticicia oligotrophica DSM 17448]|uniref:DUF1684 domain-containing protein n=1 Tax=Emticicia oligotrophica (strain DSM 17448 / CIP 109782 / MTCC 6937 / GPTSA100-15) TaxID=929562 RepID=A0ABM5MY19_EMTOG|nr:MULTISPECIES: DUF1684 domain-containing protein [Emticicia]AFK01815.1 protein of unknown function DUF1684 [Emticicia oligotrophica DSM 17448]